MNRWIRQSGAFDAVVDLDTAMRDPLNPTHMPDVITEDHLHPNAQGYHQMADAVDLGLFTTK